MIQIRNSKPQYDLEERTFNFAKKVRDFVKKLPKNICNLEYSKQLVRASGSVPANYIEANASLGKKDFLMKIRISRKEAKESGLWLRLIEPLLKDELERQSLLAESGELVRIFGTILINSTKKK